MNRHSPDSAPLPRSPQACSVEAFLRRSRAASAQQQARAEWLVKQQALEQQAADCEAALQAELESCSGRAHELPADDDAATALPTVDTSEAAALAATVAVLRIGAGGTPAVLASLREQLATAAQRVQTQLVTLGAAAAELAAGAERPSSEPAGEACLAEQVRQLCAQHPLAECASQLQADAAELEARHAQQRQERRAAWQAFAASSGSGSGSAPSHEASGSSWDGCQGAGGTADGWTADEHATFLHERTASGAEPAELARHLAALLPCRSREQVQAHERWQREAGRLQAGVQQADAAARGEAAAFVRAATALLQEAEAGLMARAEAALAQLEAAAAGLQCADALQAQREERAAQAAEEATGHLEAAALAAARLEDQRRAALDYRARMRQLLHEHREQQEEQAAAAAAAKREEAAAAAQESAAAAAANAAAVQRRVMQAAAKQAERQEQAARRREEVERRAAALDALRRRVAPVVARDAARVMAPTQSTAAAVAVERQAHGLFSAALGFTTDQVLADQRFRVLEALRGLGLHRSPAGRAAAVAAKPASSVRVDTLTSAERRQQGLK